MKLQEADIILSTTDAFISKAIRFMLRRKDDVAPFSHIAGYVGNDEIVEARNKVQKITFEKFKKQNKKFNSINLN